MFENQIIEGIYASRFIASWQKAGGNCRKDRDLFEEWLRSLVINGRNLTDREIHGICFLASNGKLELETWAKKFLRENKKGENL
jgi:hypothetical protein